jgi:uncharacterized protein YueI
MKKILLMITMILSVSQMFGQDDKPKPIEIKPQLTEGVRRKKPSEKVWDGSIKALFANTKGQVTDPNQELTLEKNGTLSKKSEMEIRKLLSVGKTKIREIKLDKESDIPFLIMSGMQGKTEMKIVGQVIPINALRMTLTYKFMIWCGGSCAGSVYSSGQPFNCAIVGHGFKNWCNCDSGCMLGYRPFNYDLLNAEFFTIP